MIVSSNAKKRIQHLTEFHEMVRISENLKTLLCLKFLSKLRNLPVPPFLDTLFLILRKLRHARRYYKSTSKERTV
jgi:hypothetical protein